MPTTEKGSIRTETCPNVSRKALALLNTSASEFVRTHTWFDGVQPTIFQKNGTIWQRSQGSTL